MLFFLGISFIVSDPLLPFTSIFKYYHHIYARKFKVKIMTDFTIHCLLHLHTTSLHKILIFFFFFLPFFGFTACQSEGRSIM